MGVRHLYSFIKDTNKVPNGVFEVDMRREVENYRRENNGKNPIIIIDLMLFHSHVYTNNHEKLLGGRFRIYNERAHAMFKAIKSMDVDLILFFDGPVQENKIETCLKRRNDSYTRGADIIETIDQGYDLNDLGNELKEVSNITTFFRNYVAIAKEYGEFHVSTQNECDQEIAYMANKVSALAVMSHDTDFLIFEGNWHYWSSNDVNFETLTTLEFNKSALRATLSLSQRQLALLGTLSGCDLLNYDDLQSFHRKILYKKDRYDKFYILADYVRSINSLPPNLNPADEEDILKYVFHPRDRKWGRKALQNSLDAFCLNRMNFDEETDFLKQIGTLSSVAYGILKNKYNIFTLTYSNLRKGNSNLYEVLRPIIQKLMGVLLQHEPQGSDLRRRHFWKRSHETPFEEILDEPRFPPFIVPRVHDLINTKYGSNEELDNKRWDILRFLISKKLNKNIFLGIPKENFITILTLFVLVEFNQITEREADCLLLSCNCPEDIEKTLSFDDVRVVKGRDVELGIYFQRIFCNIFTCIATLGLKEFLNPITFDGLYFHTLRTWTIQDPSLTETILNQFKNARIYSKEFGLIV